MDTNPVEYWNAQARDYDDNIFSTIDEDSTGIIKRTLDRFAAVSEGPFGRCIDLGCGAGKYLPALAARFRSVAAYDLSPKLVGLAKKEVKRHGHCNVDVRVRDLAQIWYREGLPNPGSGQDGQGAAHDLGDRREMESYGFAVMANVLIAPVTEGQRALMLKNAMRSLCPGGRVLVVVPSLESALYVNMRCDEANYEGPCDVLRKPSRAEGADVLQGIFRRSGVRTKHYLEPEFRLAAGRVGFHVEVCEKVLYTWRSELGLSSDLLVPAGLREPPLPWDWLFVLRKGGGPEEQREEEVAEAARGCAGPMSTSTVTASVGGPSAGPAPAASGGGGGGGGGWNLPALRPGGRGGGEASTSSPSPGP